MNNKHYSNLVSHLYLLKKKGENTLLSILRVFIFLGIYGIGIWVVSFMTQYGYPESMEMPILIGVFIILPILISVIMMNHNNSHKKMELFLSRSVTLFVQYEKSIKNEENIEEILLTTNDIYLTLNELYNLGNKLDNVIQSEVNLYMKDVQEIVLLNLKNLQNDLHKKIEDIKNILKNSNDTLTKNTAGTPYEGAYTAQKSRLDRQIGQFEELQRVLVKI